MKELTLQEFRDVEKSVINLFQKLTVGKTNETYVSPSQACRIIEQKIDELQTELKQAKKELQQLKEIHCIDVDKTSDKIAEAFGGGE